MNAMKCILPLLLLALWGCDDDEPNKITADPYINDFELVDYSYSTDSDPDDASVKLIDVEYTIRAESKPVEGVIVDFYLLPSDTSESSTMSLSGDEYKLDDSEYKLLMQIFHTDLNAGLNVISDQFTVDDVTLSMGEYELIPVIDLQGVYTDSTPENNLPAHIAHEEPTISEDGVVTIGDNEYPASKFEAPKTTLINIDESDIDVKEEELTVSTVDPIVIDYERDADYLPYFPPHEIGYNFTYRNEFLSFDNEDDRHQYVVRVYAMLNNEPNLLKIWNEEEGAYCYSNTVHIESNEDHHLGFTSLLKSERDDNSLFNWIHHYKSLISPEDNENEVGDIEFTLTLLPASEVTVDCDEEDRWAYDNPDATKHTFTSALFMNYVEKNNTEVTNKESVLASVNASDTPPQTQSVEQERGSRRLWAGSAKTVKIALENDVTLSHNPNAKKSDDKKYEVASTSSLDVTFKRITKSLTGMEFDIGINASDRIEHSVRFNVLGFDTYVDSPSASNECTEKDCNYYLKDFKQVWTEDINFISQYFLVGPIPVFATVGAQGSLELDFDFGFNPEYEVQFERSNTGAPHDKAGALYLDGETFVANLDLFAKGGIDIVVTKAGVIGKMSLVNYKTSVTGFIVPWADPTPYAAGYGYLDMKSMQGKLGLFADVLVADICHTKWFKIPFPCGTHWDEHRYWFGVFAPLYNFKDREIFNTGKIQFTNPSN